MKKGYTILESVIVIGVLLIFVSMAIGATSLVRKYKLQSDITKIKNINIAAASLTLGGMKIWDTNGYSQTLELFKDYLSEDDFLMTSYASPIYMYVQGTTMKNYPSDAFACLSLRDGDGCDRSHTTVTSGVQRMSPFIRGATPSIFFADSYEPPINNIKIPQTMYSNLPKPLACELEEIIDDNDLAWGFGRTCSDGYGCSVRLNTQIKTHFTDKIDCLDYLKDLPVNKPFQGRTLKQTSSNKFDRRFISWSLFLDIPTETATPF